MMKALPNKFLIIKSSFGKTEIKTVFKRENNFLQPKRLLNFLVWFILGFKIVFKIFSLIYFGILRLSFNQFKH